MITVTIEINDRIIKRISACNVSELNGQKYGKGMQTYKINNDFISHKFKDGAVKLGIKMLKKLL